MSNFILLLFIIVVIQSLTSILHVKYYEHKIKQLMKKYKEGYLATGVTKRTFRSGKIAILITDKEGTIIECRILSGLTVLSTFRKYQDYIGENIFSIDWEKKKHKKAVEEAIREIKVKMGKIESVTDAP